MRRRIKRIKVLLRHHIAGRAHRYAFVIFGWPIFYFAIKTLAQILPTLPVKNAEPLPHALSFFQKVFSFTRGVVNQKPVSERERLAMKYLIPTVNRLFDKNYINYAHALLLTLEEFFLSKKTEKEFEDVLKLFSSHAIAAGERFRAKFPMPVRATRAQPQLGIVAHFIAISGYEVVMGLGPSMKAFKPRAFATRAFEQLNSLSTHDAFKRAEIDLVLTPSNRYDVFELRKLVLAEHIDIAIWPVPPFHMFFFFAFGLADKQVWFSHYLRPNLEFPYLHGVMTTGVQAPFKKKCITANHGPSCHMWCIWKVCRITRTMLNPFFSSRLRDWKN